MMPMKVLFLQTAHRVDDDRIRFHQRVSLEERGHRCFFASRIAEVKEFPDLVICDPPLAVWRAGHAYGRKTPIVYDITEWYPSKKNLRNVQAVVKPFKFCALLFASWMAGCIADRFIFGEYYKAKPFRFFFFRKNSKN